VFRSKPALPTFQGFTALVLVGVSLAAALRRNARVARSAASRVFFWLALVTGIIGVLFAAGPKLILGGNVLATGPYALLYESVPFLRRLRSPERVVVLVGFAVAVLGAYGAAELLHRSSARVSRCLFVLLLVVVPLEHFRGGHFGIRIPTGERVPAVYPWLASTPADDPVVELPLFRREQYRFFAAYMLYSTFHWRPIVFGRTSFYPRRSTISRGVCASFRSGLSGTAPIHRRRRRWSCTRRFGRKGTGRTPRGPRTWRMSAADRRVSAARRKDYDRFGLGEEQVYQLQTDPPAVTRLVIFVPRRTRSGPTAGLFTPQPRPAARSSIGTRRPSGERADPAPRPLFARRPGAEKPSPRFD
jgi:hypothetical protein